MFSSLFLRMLNKEASSHRNRPGEIIESLQIREGYAIADIGSGGGYFTLEFARKVGIKGRVYAADTQPKYLAFIRRWAEQEGLKNIAYVMVREHDISLPEAGLDLAFVRNAFHHLPDPAKYFHSLKRFLNPNGKVAVIEHKPKAGFSFVAMFKHYTSSETILQAMEDAGYFLAQSFSFLPGQTFSLFWIK
jgi:ubiquinone/menaquinone biosynthesis C-methylase UbiE